ncbi:MAG: hypothetical protein GQ577_01250 [Woeseiaceae bacterium]|nr:hypothetical protein [Woeseiaceae bacterium]
MTRALLTFVLLATLAACEEGPSELRLVTPVGTIDRDIVEELAELFDNERVLTRISLTEETMSGEEALDAIAAGKADVALISNSQEFRRDIATVMPLYPTVLHIARRDGFAEPTARGDLSDAAVFAGAKGSASRSIFERIADNIGLADDDYRYVSDPSEIADMVVVFAPIAPERIAEFPELRLISMGTPQEIGNGGTVDAAVLLNPHFRPFVIPVGTYGDSTPEPIVTIAVDKILVTRSDLDSAVVYDLISDILRLRPALAAKRPGLFQQLSEDFDVSRSRFVLHPGTLDYLQRSEPTIYERYSGVAEVAVTLMIAMFTAALAGVRILRIRRKNRIDRYYAAAIEIRDSVDDQASSSEREQAIVKIRDLQNRAFDQLVDEKLGADESFRIFITLSNDVLRQLGGLAPASD